MKYPTGVENHGGKLRIWFVYKGVRVRENLGVPDTAKNRRVAGELRASVCYAIKTGVFDYAKQFPSSRNLEKFGEARQNLTIKELAEKFLALKETEVAKTSLNTYRAVIKNILSIIGEKNLASSINKEKLLEVRKELLTGYQIPKSNYIVTQPGRSAVTVNNYMTNLNAVFQFGVDNGYLNASTVRNHLCQVAQRLDAEAEAHSGFLSGCPRDWGNLPRPGKPLVVGIDGGYVRDRDDKKRNFEIIAGKSFSVGAPADTRRFGFVQKDDCHPERRLMTHLSAQGMQANQQIFFLSDGADNLRDLQFGMYPESTHVLDWFHITMRLKVLMQYARGLLVSDPEAGSKVLALLESIKRYLWHGNVVAALEHIDNCVMYCDDPELSYPSLKSLQKHLDEMYTYIRNNKMMIPNYGEMRRYGEPVSTAFVESTINEVIARRMAKKQQMQWSRKGAHYLLQTRTAVLNNELQDKFVCWYPGFQSDGKGPAMAA